MRKIILFYGAATFAIVGLGGVGSWVAEALARSGVAGLVLVDMDLYSILHMPESGHYGRWLELAHGHQKNIGVDYAVGKRLHELLAGAGLQTAFIAADQPIFNAGPGKHLWYPIHLWNTLRVTAKQKKWPETVQTIGICWAP